MSVIENTRTTHSTMVKQWERGVQFIRSPKKAYEKKLYKIPNLLKIVLSRGMEEKALTSLKLPLNVINQMRTVLTNTRSIFENGITEENYISYFHHLLWWEEIAAPVDESNCKTGVKLVRKPDGKAYMFEVEGLSARKPPLFPGDMILIRNTEHPEIVYESSVKNVMNSRVQVSRLDKRFNANFLETDLFDVLLCASRAPMQRLHEAVSRVHASGHTRRVFPAPAPAPRAPPPHIPRFYNNLIQDNEEQKSAVEHIVSVTSLTSPYILFGPPGTGKTMTVVEAIIQVVVANPQNRVLVCTESNAAADHIAVLLQQYSQQLNIDNFIFRANSQSRNWSIMPSVLAPVSNGTSCESSYPLSNDVAASYRVLVMTLSHSAKYALPKNQALHKLQMTHLFIDEAGQASEPATLVPICGLLAPSGHLVLAGDPKQLGPVCMSREAKDRGLGTSLMERLIQSFPSMYESDPNYMTMLVKNFRSHPDILKIPNNLFYGDCLQALADPDPLSKVSLLEIPGGDNSIIFHAIRSQQQRNETSPSFYNEMELDVLKMYINALIGVHSVAQEDIGIVTPYMRQVEIIRNWLKATYNKIEVGTVEAFQGKEKRVILVSTVRGNSKPGDHNTKHALGFLVDEKRFNVILTRAKAKLIIVGNPDCLVWDPRWQRYIHLCAEHNSYHDTKAQQFAINTKFKLDIIEMLEDVDITENLKININDKTFHFSIPPITELMSKSTIVRCIANLLFNLTMYIISISYKLWPFNNLTKQFDNNNIYCTIDF